MNDINPQSGKLVEKILLDWQLKGEIGYVLVWVSLNNDLTFDYQYAKYGSEYIWAGDLLIADQIISNNVSYDSGWSLNYLEATLCTN